MHPTLFQIGSLPVPSYAVFLALAFVVAWRVRKARRARLGHRSWPGYQWVRVGAMLGGIVGAKLGMFMFEPTLRIERMLSLDFTGRTVVAGLIGGYIGVELAKKREQNEGTHEVLHGGGRFYITPPEKEKHTKHGPIWDTPRRHYTRLHHIVRGVRLIEGASGSLAEPGRTLAAPAGVISPREFDVAASHQDCGGSALPSECHPRHCAPPCVGTVADA
jgi:hypothetical protein